VKVEFGYITKTEVNPIGVGGEFFTNNRLLNKVTVKVNSTTTYMTYDIIHENTSNGRKRIKEIHSKNRLNQSLPPLKFEYFANQISNDIEELPPIKIPHQIGDIGVSSLISGDFNGDERLDFIAFNNDRKEEDVFKELIYSKNENSNFIPYILEAGEFEQFFTGNYINKAGKFSNNQGIVLLRKVAGSNKIIFEVNKISYSTIGIASLDIEQTIDWDLPDIFLPHREANPLSNTINITENIGPATETKNYVASKINATNTVFSNTHSNYYANESIIFKPGFNARKGSNFVSKISSNLTNANPSMKYISGDFDGDGITDFIAINLHVERRVSCPGVDQGRPISTCPDYRYTGSKAYFISLNPKVASPRFAIGTLKTNITSTNARIFVGDFDGDGKSDIYHQKGKKIEIYSVRNNSLIYKTSINNIDNTDLILPGDFNGDGKTDIVASKSDGSSIWDFYISNGVSHNYYSKDTGLDYRENKVEWYNYRKLNGEICDRPHSNFCYEAQSLHGYSYIPVDYNKDGKTDIIRHTVIAPHFDSGDKRYSVQWVDYGTNKSTSSNYLSFTVKREVEKYNQGKPGKGHPIFADFSKTNLMNEYAYAHFDGNVDLYRYNGFPRGEVCIESVENNGLQQQFEYRGVTPIEGESRFGAIYTKNYSKSFKYPYIEIIKADDFKLLSKVTETFSGRSRYKSFRYVGLVSAANGLGLLGFNFMASSSWMGPDLNEFWSISQYDPEKRGILDRAWTVNTPANFAQNFPSNNFVSKTNYEYEYTTKPNGVYVYAPTKITNTNGLTNVTSNTTNVYDSYYNVLSSTQSYPGGSKTVSSTYYNNPTGVGVNYYIGRPAR